MWTTRPAWAQVDQEAAEAGVEVAGELVVVDDEEVVPFDPDFDSDFDSAFVSVFAPFVATVLPEPERLSVR
jgi:hypothetical protein